MGVIGLLLLMNDKSNEMKRYHNEGAVSRVLLLDKNESRSVTASNRGKRSVTGGLLSPNRAQPQIARALCRRGREGQGGQYPRRKRAQRWLHRICQGEVGDFRTHQQRGHPAGSEHALRSVFSQAVAGRARFHDTALLPVGRGLWGVGDSAMAFGTEIGQAIVPLQRVHRRHPSRCCGSAQTSSKQWLTRLSACRPVPSARHA